MIKIMMIPFDTERTSSYIENHVVKCCGMKCNLMGVFSMKFLSGKTKTVVITFYPYHTSINAHLKPNFPYNILEKSHKPHFMEER